MVFLSTTMPDIRHARRAWICVTVTLPSSLLESGV
jgi:hypothetical protein